MNELNENPTLPIHSVVGSVFRPKDGQFDSQFFILRVIGLPFINFKNKKII